MKNLFSKSKKEGAGPDLGAVPSGPGIVGPLQVDGAEKATTLKKKNILIAVAVVAAIVGGGAFAAIDLFTAGGGGSSGTAKISAGKAPNIVPVAPVTPSSIVAPAAPTASTKSATPKVPPVTVPAVAPAPAAVPANTQPTPQQTAFASALGGQGGSGGGSLSWGSDSAAAVTASANTEELAQTLAKVAVLAKPKTSVYSTHLVRKEVSPYELLQGTVIPATLETGIKSDVSGMATAVVTHPVYNSVSGAYVLIPAGSKLVGMYKSGAAMGQNRVAVMWTRVEFPNGTYIQLGKMTGADQSGYAGFRDEVNDHTWEIFKNALMLSLIDVGMSIASPTSSSTNTTGVTGNEALQDAEQSLAQTFGQAEAQLFQKYINVAPTITIRPGYRFNVVVSQDLVFPGPYQSGQTLVSGAPREVAGPSEMNPYAG